MKSPVCYAFFLEATFSLPSFRSLANIVVYFHLDNFVLVKMPNMCKVYFIVNVIPLSFYFSLKSDF